MSQGNSTSRRKALIGLGAAGAAAAGGGYFIFGNGDENGEDDDPLDDYDPGEEEEFEFEFPEALNHPKNLMSREAVYITEMAEATSVEGTIDLPEDVVFDEQLTIWENYGDETLEVGGLIIATEEISPDGQHEKVDAKDIFIPRAEFTRTYHIYAEPEIDDSEILEADSKTRYLGHGATSARHRIGRTIQSLEENLNDMELDRRDQAEDYLGKLGADDYENRSEVLDAIQTMDVYNHTSSDVISVLGEIRPVLNDENPEDWYMERAEVLSEEEADTIRESVRQQVYEIERAAFADWVPGMNEDILEDLDSAIEQEFDYMNQLHMVPNYRFERDGRNIQEMRAYNPIEGEDAFYIVDGSRFD